MTTMSNLASSVEERRSPEMRLLILAIPIMGLTVSRMLMGFIDFVMVSRLGTEAQAAISPSTMLVFTIACLGMGICIAVQTFAAQAEGRGEPRRAAAYAWQSLYLAMVAAVVTAPIALTTPLWLALVAESGNHPPVMAQLEVDYLRIAFWWVPLGVFSMGLEGFFMGIQRPRIPFIAMVMSLLTNVIGNYLLIFGKFGFPELGIAGAAIATVIGWGVRCGVLLGALLLPEFDRKYGTRHALAFRWRNLKDLFKVGSPTSLQWLVDLGAWLVFLAVIMPRYGVAEAAASNTGMQYMHMSFMPAIGIGIALCSQVGHAIGAGTPEKAVRQTIACMRLTGGYMFAMGYFFVAAAPQLMWLMNHDQDVIDAGHFVLMGAAVFQLFDAMCITYTSALRGAGDTRTPALLFFVCCWAIFIGGGLLVAWLFPSIGLVGPWAMCALYIIVLGLLLRARWGAGHWRKIRLFEEKHPQEQNPPTENVREMPIDQAWTAHEAAESAPTKA